MSPFHNSKSAERLCIGWHSLGAFVAFCLFAACGLLAGLFFLLDGGSERVFWVLEPWMKWLFVAGLLIEGAAMFWHWLAIGQHKHHLDFLDEVGRYDHQ